MSIKLVQGVGINDVEYTVHIREYLGVVGGRKKYKTIWQCPYYITWSSMLERGYSQKLKSKFPTYKDVTVCEEWHRFSTFKAWMETQDWEGRELDKDILVEGNKVYSPATCCFVSHRVNSFFLDCKKNRGNCPIGVSYDKYHKRYKSYISINKRRKHLGYFNDYIEAANTWLTAKRILLHTLAQEENLPSNVVQGLLNRLDTIDGEINVDYS